MILYSGRFLRIWMMVIVVAAIFWGAAVLWAEEESPVESGKNRIHVETWLLLGPMEIPFPVFNVEDKKSKMGASELLEYKHLSRQDLWPVAGEKVNLIGGSHATWNEAVAGTSGVLLPADTTMPRVACLAAYVEVPRWMKIDIEARSTHPFEIFIDSKSVIKRKKGGKMDAENKKTGDAKLEKGKHLLFAKSVFVPGDSIVDWRLDVNVSAAKDFDSDPVVSLKPSRLMKIEDILIGPSVEGLQVSPDGEYFAVSMSKRTLPEWKSENWVELRRFKDGKLLKTLKDLSDVGHWQWAPTGNRMSYVTRSDDAGTLRVLNLDTGEIATIVDGVKDFSGYDWSPDGTFIAYSINKEPEENKTGVKRLRGIYDRRHYERNKSSVYLTSVPAGITRKLTAGEHSTWVYDIHPDGKRILIGRSYEDLSERPYGKTELLLLNLDDQTTELLYEGRFMRGVLWSPDGNKILITGGPSTFGEVGKNVPKGVIPNDYDTQAYLFDPETKEVDPITKEFDPAVESVYWPKPGSDIYIVAEEGEYTKLYRYNLKKRSFKDINLPCDVLHRRSAAHNKPVFVFSGSGANQPWRLYAADMKSGKVRTLLELISENYRHVKIGKVEDWNFTTTSGKEIVGRIHYPPNFDPKKKWPCIVYYYGGTSPVNRSFGGRYPKNLWATNGYVVYVLQPSGATGFGQTFSAIHVNDWGKTTADEITEGTKKFLETHDFIDPEHVGCIGASYGGFMTQLLVTKTDIYAAAVSHAGISSITSYWGEGYWGYLYNAVSAAESFPWNRPDIYIDQSPLNAADKVNTPLLLLHGASDTNVPPGESEQMYTALKLLGKEVEYIRVEGQNHWIVDYKKRIVWSDAIISWFDKWLKDQPEWWEDMYPPLDKEEVDDEEDNTKQ